jgi:hypothetical protein
LADQIHPLRSTSRPLATWVPLALLVATVAVLFYRLLIGEVLFWGLPALQFYPWREFALSELRAGRLPLWNPYNGAGAPLLANYQSALLYPPNWLSLVLMPGPQAMGILAALHLVWAGTGMYLWTRSLGLSPFASGIGALAYALNGAVVARFGTQPMVDAAAWLPWLIFAVERIIRRPLLLNSALLAICAALQLFTGHAQWTAYSLGLAVLYTLYRVFVAPIQRAKIIPILALVIASLVLAVGISAVQLLPTAELQRDSQRSYGADETFALNFSYEWPVLITQITPNFYGNPGDGSYIINGAAFETDSYVGVLPLILALIVTGHCLRRWRKLRPIKNGDLPVTLVPFWALIILIAFVFALGKNSALYLFLFHHMPGFNAFQAPARWLLWVTFGLSALAAVGASLWQTNRILIMRARLGLAAGIGITVIGAVAYFGFGVAMTATIKTITLGFFTLGIQLIAVGIAFVSQPDANRITKNPNAYHRWSLAVLIFVAADLIWANFLLNPTVPASFYQPDETSAAAVDPLDTRTFQTDKAISDAQFGQFLLFKNYHAAVENQAAFRDIDLPNLNLLDRAPTFNSFEPLRPLRINHFTQLLNDPTLSNTVISHLQQAAAIGQNGSNAPRAWLASEAVVSADPFAAIQDPSWQPSHTTFVEAPAPALTALSDAPGTVSLTAQTPLESTWAVHASAPSVFTLADTDYPGWIALVDGQPTPIYQANGAFRAVYLIAGDHTVIIRYQPQSLSNGAVISAGSMIVLLLLSGLGLRWARIDRQTG